MNELIQELLEQCQIETYGVNGELLEFGFDAEKFAELIVKECVYSIPLDMDQAEYLRVMRAIKNTFRS